MHYTLHKTDTKTQARCGTIHTQRGDIQTPIFMPVGTLGTVKGIHFKELHEDIKAEIILANTYHLYLRPGMEVLHAAGGIHKFNGWNKPVLTDSGGFQVFSLAENRKITEEGAVFRSHIDGSKHLFSPEHVMDIQRTIGADIIMAFDECAPANAPYKYAKSSLELTEKWLDRCVAHLEKHPPLYGFEQTLFPIVQGCVYKDLRIQSAEKIANMDSVGNAIGGLAVGEPPEVMYEMISIVNKILPIEKPRYLMGVGTPVNILEAIALGVDMFDCVMPTRNGRNGMIFTSEGHINIKNKKWEKDFSPLDPNGSSFVDKTYSKAYVRHLIRANEMLGAQICSQHNTAFYLWLVREARQHIQVGDFESWKNLMVKKMSQRL